MVFFKSYQQSVTKMPILSRLLKSHWKDYFLVYALELACTQSDHHLLRPLYTVLSMQALEQSCHSVSMRHNAVVRGSHAQVKVISNIAPNEPSLLLV